MDKPTSLFLDLARFSMAMVVFLGHACGQLFTGGLFWQFGAYGQTAVMVFFVMSGYVISFVVDQSEHTLGDYASARLARLYSVCLPALVLTLVCDTIGLSINPSFYYDGPWGYPANVVPGYIASLFFLNELWGAGLNPGINVPFWSLGFEGIYYLMFAVFHFCRGYKRFIFLALIAAAAGPGILSLLPIWVMGCLLYRAKRRFTVGVPLSAAMLLAGLCLLVLSAPIREATRGALAIPMLRTTIVADYIDAVAFCVMLAGAWGCGRIIGTVLIPLEKPIRWTASLTFALYLFHRPLIQIFAVIGPEDPTSIGRRLLVFVGTLIVVATLGRWCEQRKGPLRALFVRLIDKLPAPRTALGKS